VLAAFDHAKASKGKPYVILARTVKGHGVSLVAGKEGWHGKPLSKDQLVEALLEVGPVPQSPNATTKEELTKAVANLNSILGPSPDGNRSYDRKTFAQPPAFSAPADPDYKMGQMMATREAYGYALKRLGAVDANLVALSADVKNSTFSEIFEDAYPQRFFQAYIAEQNMVSAGVGLAARGKTTFVDTFACFLSHAYDQIRMAAISRSNLNLCGSHCGVSIGEDGPSQMALEDLAMMRAVEGSAVLYPSDAMSAERLTELAARRPGICYLRTSRPKTPVIYSAQEKFPVPGFKVVRQSPADKATVIGAGITLHEALKAYDELKGQGIPIRVIDLYCVKPLDGKALAEQLRATAGKLVTVEDHYAQGGLGEGVVTELMETGAAPVRYKRLAVEGMPHSGKPEELVDAFGISSRHIVEAVKGIVS